jgi:hypothetical protein
VTDARRRALALAAAVFALAAPAAYVTQRLFEVSRAAGPINPVLVLRDAHTAFYWRGATAAWWGGLLAICAYAVLRRRPDARPERVLAWLAAPLAAAVALLAWWFP